jgi:hypothetical protein
MSELIKQPYEKFWDEPAQITRRELQKIFNKLAANDAELMGMADTAALILNFICEVKLKVSREEMEIYVEAKKLQMVEARAKLKVQEAQNNEQPNRLI